MKNRTLYYGEGLFETFKVYPGRKIYFVKEHLDRMSSGCCFFDIPFSPALARDAISSALKNISEGVYGRLRLNLMTYGEDTIEKTDYLVSYEETLDSSIQEQGIMFDLAPFRRFSGSPLVRFKTSSYLENITSLKWARRRNFFDSVFVNEKNEITEGSITNLFFVKDNIVTTPLLATGLLPGITRSKVIEICHANGILLKETRILVDELDGFENAFATNSIIEILPIKSIGNVQYTTSSITSFLHESYRLLISCSSYFL
ncbi:MAG: aminotransferase class IV [Pseudomonadota bacterium]